MSRLEMVHVEVVDGLKTIHSAEVEALRRLLITAKVWVM